MSLDPNTAEKRVDRTDVGSVFVSNYPPFSAWGEDQVPEATAALQAPPEPGATLGLYLHIPFCRKRCKFCYFKVYTDKDGAQVKRYLNGLGREVELYAGLPSVAGRPLKFVYFGGGTPSFISSDQLTRLARSVKTAMPWDDAEEVAFECEPGTLTRRKLEAIREIGVTRLSVGVEHFDDKILRDNGRAHVSEEIDRCMPWVAEVGFPQVNIDLIAGMVGETWETWRMAVRRTIELDPDSVTIYQMELPYNTAYSKALRDGGMDTPLADWPLKREWHDHAIEELGRAGYEVSSAYTMVKKGRNAGFVYRDSVWRGTDMVATGVASFGHMSGVHFQNQSSWDAYLERVEAGALALGRAFRMTDEERLVRETILQMKLGRVEAAYFRDKFGVDILQRFQEPLANLSSEGFLVVENDGVTLTRRGLLQVDQLLSDFYAAKYRNARYT